MIKRNSNGEIIDNYEETEYSNAGEWTKKIIRNPDGTVKKYQVREIYDDCIRIIERDRAGNIKNVDEISNKRRFGEENKTSNDN